MNVLSSLPHSGIVVLHLIFTHIVIVITHIVIVVAHSLMIVTQWSLFANISNGFYILKKQRIAKIKNDFGDIFFCCIRNVL